jgi:SAM-dependent methyltransferase
MIWMLKIIVKLIISRFPLPYRFWRFIGIFRHGQADLLSYSIRIYNLHIERAFPNGLPAHSVVLELGPGDSIISALLAYASGAKQIYLVDAGDFSRKDIVFYREAAKEMSIKGLKVPDLAKVHSFEDVLKVCNAQYLTSGILSLRLIRSYTVDFLWSHSVLEHIRKHELQHMLNEIRRIMKPGGLLSHNVDYQDHLDYSLNNLRFSERIWESSYFVNSGFYTNRIPAVKLHEMLRSTGFEIVKEEFGKWPVLPIKRSSIHNEFCAFTDADLLNRTSSVLLSA